MTPGARVVVPSPATTRAAVASTGSSAAAPGKAVAGVYQNEATAMPTSPQVARTVRSTSGGRHASGSSAQAAPMPSS